LNKLSTVVVDFDETQNARGFARESYCWKYKLKLVASRFCEETLRIRANQLIIAEFIVGVFEAKKDT